MPDERDRPGQAVVPPADDALSTDDDNHSSDPAPVLSDGAWDVLSPLINELRPAARTPPVDPRGTFEAVVWRCRTGARWRDVPPALGPWSRAAQTFIRWRERRIWARLLLAAEARAVARGLDTSRVRPAIPPTTAPLATNPKQGDRSVRDVLRVVRIAALAEAIAREGGTRRAPQCEESWSTPVEP